MDLREMIMDAIKYPINDNRKFLIFCALIVIMSLSTIVPSYGVKNDTVNMVLTLITIIVAFVVLGYLIEVLKGGTVGETTLPDLDYVKHFILGIKAMILDIIYFLIPLIITIIVASASGLFSSFTTIVYSAIGAMEKGAQNATAIMAAIPKSSIATFNNALTVTLVIGIVLFVIFSLLSFTAIVRYAKTGSGIEGLRFREILKDMQKVGVLNIIVSLIVIYVIALLLTLVIVVIGLIPYIGVFIGIFIGVPFILLFMYRAVGLLYADA
ncbi:DUF4013 domain-containing protein [uncultured Methanobrevibacter sp.]|uniref:DUF4013 domain-containing protein n=1 Tax=uncultured Methanobrevibacter sp. TaxID=253161 RepID=UPI0025E950C3|nr:DUF4013 domain-containing protein [uncultured Methanobrevibacter sp.]